RSGFSLKINLQISILQLRGSEGCTAGDLRQLGRAETEQPLAVAQQAVEHAPSTIAGAGLEQARQQVLGIDAFRKISAHAVEQIAEGGFAVGIAHRLVERPCRTEIGELAVMGEAPVLSPEFADEGMGIDQRHLADIGMADMADHHFALDQIALEHLRHFRLAAGHRVLEQTQPAALVEGDTPAILVRPGPPTALHQPGEAEVNVGRYVGAHAEQLTHALYPSHLGGTWQPRTAWNGYSRGSIRLG